MTHCVWRGPWPPMGRGDLGVKPCRQNMQLPVDAATWRIKTRILPFTLVLVSCSSSRSQAFFPARLKPLRTTAMYFVRSFYIVQCTSDMAPGSYSQGRDFHLKSGGYKNSTCGWHRARRRSQETFERFCAERCIFSHIRGKENRCFLASWTTRFWRRH